MSDSAEHKERKRLLVIEDDAHIRSFLRISLEAHGFSVVETRLGKEGIDTVASGSVDLVVLDLGLPDIDGQDVLRRIREWSTVPIIVLSARSDEKEKVEALDGGADDYVTKPFGISEFMARIRVCLRSRESRQNDEGIFRTGDLEVDLVRRRVQLSGRDLSLSRKEYELLCLFISHPDQVLTHQQILTKVWGDKHTHDTHYLRVLVGHLRQKLGEPPARPRFIETVQGVGYRLNSS